MTQMEPLKRNFQLVGAFKRCQLCSHTSDDICAFRMWYECDENDKTDPNNVIVTCRQKACMKTINDAPRLYIEVPWGFGGAGKFMLLCGDCKYRNEFSCKHPNLTANGGKGLEVKLAKTLDVRVCFHDGTSATNLFPQPAVECAGKEVA